MKTFALILDLVDDQKLINEYKKYHEDVWPEIISSIKESGILNMKIYNLENRLFMTVETTDEFSFEKKSEEDSTNPKVLEWEALMWKYQKALPVAQNGEKWLLMNKIFDLNEQA
jgi:L-rhamnose mutarotase